MQTGLFLFLFSGNQVKVNDLASSKAWLRKQIEGK